MDLTSGTSQSFTMTPDTGYQVNDVTIDGVSQGAITTFTFSDVQLNHTISATFKPIIYTVSFHANGGNGSIPAQSIAYGSTANLTSNTFTNYGYTFSGWTNASGASYPDGGNLTMGAENVILYAKWTAITYTVNFSCMFNPPAQTTVYVTFPATNISTSSNIFPSPTSFVYGDIPNNYWIFQNWYIVSGGTNITFTDTTPVTNNITVTAYWKHMP